MTFEQARAVLHAWLFEWAERRHETPTTPISGVYGAKTPPHRAGQASQQERWVMSRERVLQVDAAVRRLPPTERAMLELRFAERARWSQIERRLGLTQRTRVLLWDGALWQLATWLGLLDGEAAAPTPDALPEPSAPADDHPASWEPWQPFEVTADYISGFLTAWERPPSCYICGRPVRVGDDVQWAGEAPDGLAHLRCLVGVKGSTVQPPRAASETGLQAA